MTDHDDYSDHDKFVPPPAPPIKLSSDPITVLAWIGVLGGPLVIVLVGILASSIPVLLGAIATIAFVGGFVTLVARAKPRAKQDDGWDDGAVL